MNRGEIYWVNLEPAKAPELGKMRPALIVSNSETNQALDSVVMVPLSSRPPEIWPLRMEIHLASGSQNLPKKSFAVIAGIRQVAKSRIQKFQGIADDASMKKIDEAVQSYLSE
ncbi:MAG: type II toxin-antitoxin system PemK/MazF family toxin [Spirochaetia bacterium]|nr:type II toxin-antitoxin system PemK/MazF family toxin [Spirochaetia bacterium]